MNVGEVYRHSNGACFKVTKIHVNGLFDGVWVYHTRLTGSFYKAGIIPIGSDWKLDKEYQIQRLLKAIDQI